MNFFFKKFFFIISLILLFVSMGFVSAIDFNESGSGAFFDEGLAVDFNESGSGAFFEDSGSVLNRSVSDLSGGGSVSSDYVYL